MKPADILGAKIADNAALTYLPNSLSIAHAVEKPDFSGGNIELRNVRASINAYLYL